jgi:hypothetical protein
MSEFVVGHRSQKWTVNFYPLLDENTLLDVDRDGNMCGITVEHASQRVDIPRLSYEQVAA